MKPELVDHRKFLRLKRLLGEPTPHVIGYLTLMWRRGYQTGNPLLGDELDVEAAAEFLGEPRKFATAAHESGFIDRTDDGLYLIHDLWDHAPEWAKKRMMRVGNSPAGITEYSGIKKGEKRRAAAKTPKRTPRGGQNAKTDAARSTERREKREEIEETTFPIAAEPPTDQQPGAAIEPEPAKKPRQRCELFDAIAEATGADPVVAGAHVGRVRAKLLSAEPPYSPEEVREFARDFWRHCPYAAQDNRQRPTLGEIEKNIGLVRAKPPPKQTPPPPRNPANQSRGAAADQYAARMIADHERRSGNVEF